MASLVPVKSQPLHNFSLPHLKWKNHRTGRSRLAGDTSSSSSPPYRSPSSTSHPHIHQSSPYVSRRPSPLQKQSPMRDSESESELTSAVPIGKPVKVTKVTKSTKSVDTGGNGKRSSKICIRIRNNNVNMKHDAAVIEENHTSTPVEKENEYAVVPSSAAKEEEEESATKTWNLRPRRSPMNHKQSKSKIGSSQLQENRYFQGSYYYFTKEASEVKFNEHSNIMTSTKRKFSISLSRGEIEEDMFSLTGAKPSRRPKKRPRTLQKQLDTLFPGLWLGLITADSYKVSEAPPKS